MKNNIEKTERNKEMFKKHKEGQSYGKIGEYYNCSRQNVMRIIKIMESKKVGD